MNNAAAMADTGGLNAVAQVDMRLLVDLDTTADVDSTVAELSQIGQIEEQSPRRVRMTANAARLQEIAEMPGVLSAEVEPSYRATNDISTDSQTEFKAPAEDFGLDGSGGDSLGVADTGLDTEIQTRVLDDFARACDQHSCVGDRIGIRASRMAPSTQSTTAHTSVEVFSGDGALSNGRVTGMAPARD